MRPRCFSEIHVFEKIFGRPGEDNICWAAALGALERCGRWQEALQLLMRMLDLFAPSFTRIR